MHTTDPAAAASEDHCGDINPEALCRPASIFPDSSLHWSQMQGNACSRGVEGTQGKEPQDPPSQFHLCRRLVALSWVGEIPGNLIPRNSKEAGRKQQGLLFLPHSSLGWQLCEEDRLFFAPIWWYFSAICHKDVETSHPLRPAQAFK